MRSTEEYSYDELDEDIKTQALLDIDSFVRGILGLNRGPRFTNRSSIECIIADLEPVFDKNGKAKYYSKKYTEITKELIKDIYDQCRKVK